MTATAPLVGARLRLHSLSIALVHDTLWPVDLLWLFLDCWWWRHNGTSVVGVATHPAARFEGVGGNRPVVMVVGVLAYQVVGIQHGPQVASWHFLASVVIGNLIRLAHSEGPPINVNEKALPDLLDFDRDNRGEPTESSRRLQLQPGCGC